MNDLDIIKECTEKLDQANAESYAKLEKYLLGQQPLAFLSDEARKLCGNRLKPLHLDWPRLIIRSVEERVGVEDFRLANQESFTQAWDIWQRNNMDEGSQLAHFDAFLYGRSFVSVWKARGKATLAVESARQVWVEHDAADSRVVKYGIKRWYSDGRGYLRIYVPDGEMSLYRTVPRPEANFYNSTDPIAEAASITNLPVDAWEKVPGQSVFNSTGITPLFPIVNRRRILNPHGESQLTEILPIADAINKLATDMMVSAESHAEPRRWATGVEIVEDENGEVRESFSTLRGRTWTAEDPQARIGSLPEADLQNFISAIEMLEKILGAMGGIPPHYVDAAKGSLASADSIRAATEPLVAIAKRFMTGAGGAWEDAMRFALSLEGVAITPAVEKMEVRWADPENRTQAQIVDSAIKRKAVGVPQYQLWEDMGYSKAQIERMKKMEAEERQRASEAAAAVVQGQGGAADGGPELVGAGVPAGG